MTKYNAGDIFIAAVCIYMAALNQRVRPCVVQQHLPLMTAPDRQRLFRDIQMTSVSSLPSGVTETTGIGQRGLDLETGNKQV
jgi:hypothetical protein